MQHYFVLGIASFFGGWCGTVPISVIIWWLIHHGGRPPIPDPWWKISIAGALTGLVLGATLVSLAGNELSIPQTLSLGLTLGIAGGLIGGGLAGKSALSALPQQKI